MQSHRLAFAGSFRSILCPVDFSKHSAVALRYAAAIANRSHGRLIVQFVNDPLLASAAAAVYAGGTPTEDGENELRRFVVSSLGAAALKIRKARLVMTTGKPVREIVEAATRERCDLIVMGTHGLGRAARMLFGSTTQGVLQRATLPVLAIPPVERARSERPRRRPAGRRHAADGFVSSLTTRLARAAQERDRVEIEAIQRLVHPRKPPAPKRHRPKKRL